MSKTAASPKKYGETGTFTRIVRDKSVMHRQPVIKGTRIPVSLIFDYLADGYSIKDILEQFPHLTPEDVNEALRYAVVHKVRHPLILSRKATIREYTSDEISRFLKEDRLDLKTAKKFRRLLGKHA